MKSKVEYLRNNFAKPGLSTCSSSCFLVWKQDGSVRFCTEFCKAIALTASDSFRLQCVEHFIDNLGTVHYIT